MQKFTLFLVCSLCLNVLFAQKKQTWNIAYQPFSPALDGQLTDSCWQTLPSLGDFTTSTPVFGAAPHCRTEVRLFYTETALFVAVRCFDPDPGGVRYDGSARDGQPTGDWFGISLDTWNDGQLAFDFTVSAAGVQSDERQGNNTWDTRWQSAVARQADGWSVEMRIPFSALRYARQPEHTWGLQCTRFDRGSGETSTWNPQDPLVEDRVLQFGTLTGLRDIRQMHRHALAVHSNTAFTDTDSPFSNPYLRQSLGIDGRLGLNESTTLDVTLLPPLGVNINLNDALYNKRFSDVYGNLSLPGPRQLEAEELSLFARGGNLNYTPIVRASQLTWRLDLSPDERATGAGESTLLNAVKLSTRTKGNWRFGAYNAVLGPVKTDIYSLSSFEPRKKTLQAVSDYHYLAAEYVLRNNGFVQLSNSALLAGPGQHTVTPALNFRVRDRQNRYEITGIARLNQEHSDTVSTRSAFYNLGIGSINRRWGWRVNHRWSEPAASGTSFPGFIISNPRTSGSVAQATYRSFQPYGSFLNTRANAGAEVEWAMQPGDQTIANLFASLTVLDRRFRSYSVYLNTIPYEQTLRYENRGAYLPRRVAPRIGGGLQFDSDQRRKFTWKGSASGRISTRGELPEIRAGLGAAWVIGPRFTLSLNTDMKGNLENLVLLDLPGEWIFERSRIWNANAGAELDWYLRRSLRLFVSAGWYLTQYTDREAVELQPDGHLMPVSQNLPELFDLNEGTVSLGFQYFFNAVSQIRFAYSLNPDVAYRSQYLISGPFFFKTTSSAQLSVICLFGGGR